jgi:membrane fusion protein (multidrug efflux system)
LPPRGVLVFGAALAIGAGGVFYLNASHASATTDNAYLKADDTIVAPRVKGHVAQVLVADNQTVQAGQVLVRLDPDEYAARVAGARGDLALAEASVAQGAGRAEPVDVGDPTGRRQRPGGPDRNPRQRRPGRARPGRLGPL